MRKILCKIFTHLWTDSTADQVCAWCGAVKGEHTMQRNYLNQAEKKAVMIAGAASTAIGMVIEEIAAGADKKALADLKRGQSFVIRGLEQYTAGKDEKSRQGILKLAQGVTIGAVMDDKRLESRHKAYAAYVKKIREQVYEEQGGRDHIMDMAEVTLASACSQCNGAPRHDGCPLYEAYQAYQIEPWDVQHPACEYAGTGR